MVLAKALESGNGHTRFLRECFDIVSDIPFKIHQQTVKFFGLHLLSQMCLDHGGKELECRAVGLFRSMQVHNKFFGKKAVRSLSDDDSRLGVAVQLEINVFEFCRVANDLFVQSGRAQHCATGGSFVATAVALYRDMAGQDEPQIREDLLVSYASGSPVKRGITFNYRPPSVIQKRNAAAVSLRDCDKVSYCSFERNGHFYDL